MARKPSKPRPQDAAKNFLAHTLDALPEVTMFDKQWAVTRSMDRMAFELGPESTYKDLLPCLGMDEDRESGRKIVAMVRDKGKGKLADQLEDLLNLPQPVEKNISFLGLSPIEELASLALLKKAAEIIETERTLPAFFETLEAIARNERPKDYKGKLQAGYARLKLLTEMTKEMGDMAGDKPLPDGVRAANEGMRSLALKTGEGMFGKGGIGPSEEEEIARAMAAPFETAAKLSKQFTQMCEDAKTTCEALNVTVGRERG